jgi:antitoxin component YwqK of YwqJK toxin-antitoxin module
MNTEQGVYSEQHNTKNNEGDTALKNGPQRHWYKNGYLEYEKNYKDGYLDGSWQEWFESGQLHYLKNYSNGVKNGTFEIYCENGAKYEKLHYSNDKLDGEQFYYSAQCDNVLLRKNSYKNGLKDGLEYRYYSSSSIYPYGELDIIVPYKNGVVDGKVTSYSPNEFSCVYNNGNCVEEKLNENTPYCPCGWFSQ